MKFEYIKTGKRAVITAPIEKNSEDGDAKVSIKKIYYCNSIKRIKKNIINLESRKEKKDLICITSLEADRTKNSIFEYSIENPALVNFANHTKAIINTGAFKSYMSKGIYFKLFDAIVDGKIEGIETKKIKVAPFYGCINNEIILPNEYEVEGYESDEIKSFKKNWNKKNDLNKQKKIGLDYYKYLKKDIPSLLILANYLPNMFRYDLFKIGFNIIPDFGLIGNVGGGKTYRISLLNKLFFGYNDYIKGNSLKGTEAKEADLQAFTLPLVKDEIAELASERTKEMRKSICTCKTGYDPSKKKPNQEYHKIRNIIRPSLFSGNFDNLKEVSSDYLKSRCYICNSDKYVLKDDKIFTAKWLSNLEKEINILMSLIWKKENLEKLRKIVLKFEIDNFDRDTQFKKGELSKLGIELINCFFKDILKLDIEKFNFETDVKPYLKQLLDYKKMVSSTEENIQNAILNQISNDTKTNINGNFVDINNYNNLNKNDKIKLKNSCYSQGLYICNMKNQIGYFISKEYYKNKLKPKLSYQLKGLNKVIDLKNILEKDLFWNVQTTNKGDLPKAGNYKINDREWKKSITGIFIKISEVQKENKQFSFLEPTKENMEILLDENNKLLAKIEKLEQVIKNGASNSNMIKEPINEEL